jgi:hypothetical protein
VAHPADFGGRPQRHHLPPCASAAAACCTALTMFT